MPPRAKSFADLAEPREYRWPKKCDRLIRPSGNWERGVTFPKSARTRHVYIWSGYFHAAEALIRACDDDPTARELLIYPILFTYRHAIELAMKWVITQYGCYADVETGEIEHHDLWSLWKICRVVIAEVGGQEDPALPAVEQLIKEIHDLDKSGMAFRYSAKKGGAAIKLPEGAIDLENVRDVMEGVGNFFDGADGLLDANASAALY